MERQQSIEAGYLFPSPKARPRKYVPRNRGPGLSQDGDGRSWFISKAIHPYPLMSVATRAQSKLQCSAQRPVF